MYILTIVIDGYKQKKFKFDNFDLAIAMTEDLLVHAIPDNESLEIKISREDKSCVKES